MGAPVLVEVPGALAFVNVVSGAPLTPLAVWKASSVEAGLAAAAVRSFAVGAAHLVPVTVA